MRPFLVAVIVCSGPVAFANADPAESVPSDAPAACVALSKAPGDATSRIPELAGRISMASCLAEARFAALRLAPDDASIAALAEAARPSFALLDAVIRDGDAVTAPIAQRARADLFVSMVVRMRNSIPPITMETTGAQLTEHDRLHAAIEPKIAKWLAEIH